VFPMQQLSIRHLFVGAFAALLVAPAALAQSSQHRESDLDFINRLTARAEQLDARVSNMYAVTGIQPTGRSRRSGGGGLSVDTQGSATARPAQPGAGAIDGTDLDRMSRKLRSITKKLESEHKKISSGEPRSEKQLAKSEKNLQRIDLDLTSIDNELTSMERMAY
jgi:hypothetical protein